MCFLLIIVIISHTSYQIHFESAFLFVPGAVSSESVPLAIGDIPRFETLIKSVTVNTSRSRELSGSCDRQYSEYHISSIRIKLNVFFIDKRQHPRASLVIGPQMPSTSRPLSNWKARRAPRVILPKSPSISFFLR